MAENIIVIYYNILLHIKFLHAYIDTLHDIYPGLLLFILYYTTIYHTILLYWSFNKLSERPFFYGVISLNFLILPLDDIQNTRLQKQTTHFWLADFFSFNKTQTSIK